MEYDELAAKSLYIDELIEILAGLRLIRELPAGIEGELVYRNNNGEQLAKYWLNTEIEEWAVLIDVERE